MKKIKVKCFNYWDKILTLYPDLYVNGPAGDEFLTMAAADDFIMEHDLDPEKEATIYGYARNYAFQKGMKCM